MRWIVKKVCFYKKLIIIDIRVYLEFFQGFRIQFVLGLRLEKKSEIEGI